MTTFITKENLLENLNSENVRVIDCRFQLGSKEIGRTQYLEGHIPGAIYFHLEEDLSGVVETHGGRHPLPRIEDFKQLIENAGVTNKTKVIVYDNGEGAFAGRCWWLLKYVGHEDVYILDGGYKEWSAAHYPVTTLIPTFATTSFDIHIQEGMLATVEDVKDAVKNRNSTLVDSRESKRYLGIEEHVDKKAGHIPTAINKPWMEGFQNGVFKKAADQSVRFNDIEKDKPIIVYCGSGITATPNFIALKEAGYENVKLYAGSFSDWISYDENEVATKE